MDADMGEVILDDLDRALEDLDMALHRFNVKNDSVRSALIEDAQIYCFQKAVITLKAFLLVFFDETDERAFDKDSDLLMKYMAFLCLEDVISKDQFERFGWLFAASEAFSNFEMNLTREQREDYKAEAQDLNEYYYLMCEFLEESSDDDDENSQEEQDDEN